MRRSWLTISVVLLVFAGLVGYLFVYSVPVDKVAAHYRLGEVIRIVRPPLGNAAEEDGLTQKYPDVPVVRRAGWFFKLPVIDTVRDFDQRIRYVDGPKTQMQLPDENQLIPRVYATWRVEDPVAYEATLGGQKEKAQSTLRDFISGRTPEVIGRYPLSALVNTDEDELKFEQVEREVFEAVKESVESAGKDYGIEVTSLGIQWLALPEEATREVFGRMEQERKTEARKLVERGRRIRRTTIADAEQERDRILADAEAKAKRIRAEAEAEAAKTYEVFAKAPELAIFLRRLEAFRKMAEQAAENEQPMTLVLSTQNPPFDILEGGPLREGAGEEQKLELPVPLEAEARPGTALREGSEGG
jgi:membrane protease subunit HflC